MKRKSEPPIFGEGITERGKREQIEDKQLLIDRANAADTEPDNRNLIGRRHCGRRLTIKLRKSCKQATKPPPAREAGSVDHGLAYITAATQHVRATKVTAFSSVVTGFDSRLRTHTAR